MPVDPGRAFRPDGALARHTLTFTPVGHLLGAAGAIEAAFCALAIRDQVMPPTLNLDSRSGLDLSVPAVMTMGAVLMFSHVGAAPLDLLWGVPMVLALNMHDEAAARGVTVDGYMGHAELWFDRAALSGATPERRIASERAVEDERRFIDFKRSCLWLAKEHIFVDHR